MKQKVVVFGGSGFLGKAVADELSNRYRVVIYDTDKPGNLRANQQFVSGDILDSDAITRVLGGARYVFNFAAISNIDYAHANPVSTIQTNVLGNTYILDGCVKNRVRWYVFASTIYVYSDKGSFYRVSKQACELLIEAYQETYGLPYTIVRYGSVYGPDPGENNWLHTVVEEALTRKTITRHGDGEELREYIHVRDAARASADILVSNYRNKHIVITGGQKIRMKDLLNMIREMLGPRVKIKYLPITDARSAHYEMTPFIFKPRLAQRLIISPHVDLGEGILDCAHKIYSTLHVKKRK